MTPVASFLILIPPENFVGSIGHFLLLFLHGLLQYHSSLVEVLNFWTIFLSLFLALCHLPNSHCFFSSLLPSPWTSPPVVPPPPSSFLSLSGFSQDGFIHYQASSCFQEVNQFISLSFHSRRLTSFKLLILNCFQNTLFQILLYQNWINHVFQKSYLFFLIMFLLSFIQVPKQRTLKATFTLLSFPPHFSYPLVNSSVNLCLRNISQTSFLFSILFTSASV